MSDTNTSTGLKATKGPWRASHRQDEACTISGFTHIKVGDDAPLAYVINPDDADLIAAAPELHYALHSIMAELANSSGRPSAIAQERARVALAKAEGRTR